MDLPGPGYFELRGIGLVDGTFTHRDVVDAPPVMVVSEALARVNFPGQRAVQVDGDPMPSAPLMQRVVSTVDPTRPARDVLSTRGDRSRLNRAAAWLTPRV